MIGRSRFVAPATAVCLLTLLLLASTGAVATSHVVQRGETLYSLAKRYGTSVQDLVGVNGVGQDYVIRVGQVLSIPAASSAAPTPPPAAQRSPAPNPPGPSSPAPDGQTATALSPQAMGKAVNSIASGGDIEVPGFSASVAVGRPPVGRGVTQAGDRITDVMPKPSVKPAGELARESASEAASEPAKEPAEESAKEPAKESTGGVISLAAGELELLARLVMAEAGNEAVEGQVAVAAVVVNRVKHKAFPKTVTEVINEPGQFKSVELGRLSGLAPGAAVLAAVQRALAGEDPTGGAIFFYNPAKSTALEFWKTRPVTTTIGNHRFAR